MSILGNNKSANFLFFNTNDDSNLPSKNEFSNYFPKHEIKIYKVRGFFKNELMYINNAIFIMKNGISKYASKHWVNEFEYAIRINQECKASSFFNLKYPEIVKQYCLDKKNLTMIIKIISAIDFVLEANNHFKRSRELLDVGKYINKDMMLSDLKMSPEELHISSLFDDYGSTGLDRLYEQILDWDKKVIWL